MTTQYSAHFPLSLKQSYVSTPEEFETLVQIADQSREIERPKKSRTTEQELFRSRYLYRQAHRAMHNVLLQLKQGQTVDTGHLLRLTQSILLRIEENRDAFLAVCRFKQRSEYVYMRAVSFTALMLAFARHMGFSERDLLHMGVGALLHDAGKMWLPTHLLTKPGRLNKREKAEVEQHTQYTRMIYAALKNMHPLAVAIGTQHHERIDGSGYPQRLRQDQISLAGQMAGIADVFDAMTSDRYYRNPAQPSQALRQLLKNDAAFDASLAQQFVKLIGIYPVGSAVQLDNGIIGIVQEQTADLLRPVILVVYDMEHRRRLPAYSLRLQDADISRIVASDPTQVRINPLHFLV